MYLFDGLALVGSIALFLFGMELLSTGLHKLSGQHMQRLLARSTRSVWCSVLLGSAVTAVVQSSSAVTVVIVGLVAGGTLTLEQSAGLIAGANIGTCVTAFLVYVGLTGSWMGIFHSSWMLFLLCFLFPFLLCRRCPAFLQVCAGLCALLTGMAYMQDALAPLAGTPLFTQLLATCTSPLSAVLSGIFVTAVLQSSSACIALLQTISASGLLPLSTVIPIILGQNIGTCVTALLAALHADRAARQTAQLHLLFNLFGAIAILVPLFVVQAVAPHLIARPADSGLIAVIHLLCNITAAFVFLPLRNVVIAQMTKSSLPPKRKTAVK